MAFYNQQQTPQGFGGMAQMPQYGPPQFGGQQPNTGQPNMGGMMRPNPFQMQRPQQFPGLGGLGQPVGQWQGSGGQSPDDMRRQAALASGTFRGQQMPRFNMPQPQQMPNIPGMPPQSGPGGQWQTGGGESPADARRQQGERPNPFMMGGPQQFGGFQQPIYQMPRQPQGQPFNNPFGGGPTAFTPNLPPERQPQPRQTVQGARNAMLNY